MDAGEGQRELHAKPTPSSLQLNQTEPNRTELNRTQAQATQQGPQKLSKRKRNAEENWKNRWRKGKLEEERASTARPLQVGAVGGGRRVLPATATTTTTATNVAK